MPTTADHAFDLVVIGAGAAGMMCASVAGQRGARVALVDHAATLAEKIRISGGGRCNFTNLEADRPERFVSQDPRFARAALRQYRPRRFVELVRRHGIGFHEKHRGQLFGDESSGRIIRMLVDECAGGGVRWFRPVQVQALRVERGAPASPTRFALDTGAGTLHARHVVVATGGLSIPKIGATDFAHRIARELGLAVVDPRPGLVPLLVDTPAWRASMAALAGVATPVGIALDAASGAAAGEPRAPAFEEDLLFTHRGLSGPAALQISSYWLPGRGLRVDLAPGVDVEGRLVAARASSRQQLGTVLAELLPRRLAGAWLAQTPFGTDAVRRIAEIGNARLVALARALRDWPITPTGTEGYAKAEVTVGGVATDELDPATLQARRFPGLFFVGEAVDVTGWLGGYNFQWAWASGHAAAMACTAAR